ncbi:MAG: hypothetical protein E7D28_06715 [Clostridium sp.]|uniref:hypothetical protein n=1 Tax=Clostridium sp. TaxID=1506 RepID=UPI002901FDB1|nr:hypothetical protein [Clostridium sp.]MDU2459636.1 hypothetical protein [Clostridium sp.]
MIIIKQALYLNDGERKLVLAEDITKAEYEETYKGKLFCPIEGCSAEFVHKERQKGGNTSYFCTLPNSEHKENCPNKVNRDGERARRISIDGIGGVELNEGHARNVLRDTYKLATGKKKKSSSGGKRSKGKSPVTGGKDSVEEVKTTITGGGIIGKEISEKQPYVYKKSVSDFLISPIDTYCVYGEVVAISTSDDEVVFTIKDSKNKLSIYAGNPFKINYPQEFKLLNAFKRYLDSCSDSPVICACICISKKTKDGMVAELMDYRNIFINDLSLMQVVNFLNQLTLV